MNKKTAVVVLVTAIITFMLHDKLATLPGVNKLPRV